MQLFNDDCLNVLKNIPSESVDLVVTDCPYHIVSGGCTTIPKNNEPGGIFDRRSTFTQENAKSGKLFDNNEILFSEWLPEIYRVVKDSSHIYIYINARNLCELQTEAEKCGFIFQNILIWDKGNVTPNRYYLNGYEMILMLRKGSAKNINNMSAKNIIYVDNIIGDKTHPTEKPVAVNRYLIENSSNINDVVLDPFMGTGSCGIACRELKRDFIGVEIDKKYFDIAKERIENTNMRKQKLF